MGGEHNLNDRRYLERCLRSMGIMTEEQLFQIRDTPVAIGGLGLGGSVFINLVRLGFQKFHIADPDIYERTNINRQRCARETTVNRRKDECLLEEAKSINPDVDVRMFPDGVNKENVSDFLNGMQWAVDAIDVFAMPEKIALHDEALKRKIPVVSCVSVGFGAAIVTFTHRTPSFRLLSGVDEGAPYATNLDRFVKYAAPVVPEYMTAQLGKAMDKSSHIPFVVPGVEFSAGLVCTEICKHILGIGEQVVAPHGIYFDPVSIELSRYVADWRVRDKQLRKTP